jgi:predicted aspartyl protease
MKLVISILTVSLVLFPSLTPFAGKLYKWVDRAGNLHFSDSPASIPSEYRDQVDVNEFWEPEQKTSDRNTSKMPVAPDTLESTGDRRENERERHEIPFTAYEGMAKRIIVPVKINDAVTANMALDTGAPGMIITPQLAERLGLFEGSEGMVMIMAGGIGGQTPAVRTIIDSIQIGGARDKFIPTTVVPIETNAFEGLIGMDFMSGYSINIEPKRKVVIFTRMPSDPNLPGGHNEEWWRAKFREFSSVRNEWNRYKENLEGIIRRSDYSDGSELGRVKEALEMAEYQQAEAEKLYFKLNSYAIDNAVPMSWREY